MWFKSICSMILSCRDTTIGTSLECCYCIKNVLVSALLIVCCLFCACCLHVWTIFRVKPQHTASTLQSHQRTLTIHSTSTVPVHLHYLRSLHAAIPLQNKKPVKRAYKVLANCFKSSSYALSIFFVCPLHSLLIQLLWAYSLFH